MPLLPVFLGLALVLGYWQYWRWTHKRMLQLAALVPGPPALPILGNALMFMVNSGDQLTKVSDLFKKYGEYVKFWLGPDLNICVKNPADIRLLLTSNKVNQKGPVYKLMETYIGPGILTGGPTWRNHRKIATPSYNKKFVQHCAPLFNKEAEELAKIFSRKDPTTFNAYFDVVDCTTQCVCQTLMGLSKEESLNLKHLKDIVQATPRIYDQIFTKMTKWWLQIPLIYHLTGLKEMERKYVKLIDDFTSEIVNKRKLVANNANEETIGIVDRYILSGELNEQEIKWESFSLFTTSQEASAKITCGVLLFLAHLPEWQEKVYDEIIEVLGPNFTCITIEDLKKLQYLDMVYKEAMRVLSIAALIQRTVEEEITINDGKYTLPAGTSLVIPIHEVHRDTKYWDEPLKVMPQRFLPENVKKRDPNAFIPFSLGAMDCLGRVYATALIKILIVWILRYVKLEADGRVDDLKLYYRQAYFIEYIMSWPLYVVFGFGSIFWLVWRYKNRRLIRMADKLPGPRTLPFVGNALLFMCKPDEFINITKDLILKYGEIFRVWLGPDLNIIVSNPDDLKFLLSNMKSSVKGPQYKYMANYLGGGILSGSGPTWRKHRKIAAPNYGKPAIENYNDLFNKEVDILLETFRGLSKGKMFDIYEYVVKSTSYTVCQALMGLSREQTLSLPHLYELIERSPRLYDLVFDRMTKWYLQIEPIYRLTGYYQEQKHFINIMTDFGQKILEYRKEKLKTIELESKVDLMNIKEDAVSNTELSVIDRLILSQELSDEELIQETFTIFTSSQEATAKIASFTLLMMAYHPKCQKKLVSEIDRVLGDEDRWVTDEDLKRMPYLEMVFKEVVRLYPIGAMLQRTIQEDISISTGTLPAGSSLVAPIYHLHRHPRFWENPEAFDPERFNPENTKLRPPSCYIPFSAGPMDCLGRYFGTKLVKILCIRVLREFEIKSLETYNDLTLYIAISAKPLNGFNAMLLHRRRNIEVETSVSE
ncbi:hypothetical protein K1T71_011395 [Dendrolimus kikuchii]|uniref:Uncharacterized protein n=1 Tax=Dendrolimus kikuchii TaxID=765133 RepID=A0ACC1CNP7_9NEOP|nr:hypothetical protein K1T71_011395 [Dendrolimus kikuchii]